MATDPLTPGSERRVTFLKALLKEGIYPKAVGPLVELIALEHVSCCLCEPICLNEDCDCEDDSHLDPDCYFLRAALHKTVEDFYKDLLK